MTATYSALEAKLKPAILCQPENVPHALRQCDQWVTWRLEDVGRPKLAKIPYTPTTGRRADPSDPATGSSFEDAVKAFRTGSYSGIGFIFGGDTFFVGGDIDDCVDDDGNLSDEARAYVDLADTYTEKSPSGRGIKFIARGKKIGGVCRRGKFEMYDGNRFFTLTGCRLEGTPQEPQDRDDALAGIYRAWFPEEEKPDRPQYSGSSCFTDLSDAALIETAQKAKNGSLFTALLNGQWERYDSQSNADLAFCGMLAFYAGANGEEQVDRIFRQSGLYREKWDRDDYREKTIRKAYAGRTVFYDPARSQQPPVLTPTFPGENLEAEEKRDEVENSRQYSRRSVPLTERSLHEIPAFSSAAEWEKYGSRMARNYREFTENFKWASGMWYICADVPDDIKRKVTAKLFGDKMAYTIKQHYAPTVKAWLEQGRQPDMSFTHHEALNTLEPEQRAPILAEYRRRAEEARTDTETDPKKRKRGMTAQEMAELAGKVKAKRPARGWGIPKEKGLSEEVAELLGDWSDMAGSVDVNHRLKEIIQAEIERLRNVQRKPEYKDADDGLNWSNEELVEDAQSSVEKWARREWPNDKPAAVQDSPLEDSTTPLLCNTHKEKISAVSDQAESTTEVSLPVTLLDPTDEPLLRQIETEWAAVGLIVTPKLIARAMWREAEYLASPDVPLTCTKEDIERLAYYARTGDIVQQPLPGLLAEGGAQ